MFDRKFLFAADHENMLQTDETAFIGDDAHDFIAAGQFAVFQFVVRVERDRFDEIEGDMIIAGHGEDGFAVGFELRVGLVGALQCGGR